MIVQAGSAVSWKVITQKSVVLSYTEEFMVLTRAIYLRNFLIELEYMDDNNKMIVIYNKSSRTLKIGNR